LLRYVNAGGNVYLAAGTGSFAGGPAAEAAFWDPFLNAFGLGLGTPYNAMSGVVSISSTHPIFDGVGGVVTGLYQNNGNDSLDIDALDARGQVLVTSSGHDLYAVYDSGPLAAPEPSILLLLGSGIAGAFRFARPRGGRGHHS
jgi:PEP-CTERM motif